MQTSRFTAALRKLLSIKGEENPIGFGVHLEDERVEYSFLKNEVLWAQTQEVTSDATHVIAAGVANPAGSGVLGVIQTCFVSSDTVGISYRLGYQNAVITPATQLQPRDLRWRPGLGGSLRGFASGGGVGSGFTGIYAEIVSIAANAVIDFMALPGRIPPIVIAPGYTVYISQAAVGANVAKVTMAGYERPLESGELL